MEIKDLIREFRAIYTCSLKEAIEDRGYDLKEYIKTFDQIESSVKELEKYKQTFEEVEVKFTYLEQMSGNTLLLGREERLTYKEIRTMINEAKQKYFPKPTKTTVTVEIPIYFPELWNDTIRNAIKGE